MSDDSSKEDKKTLINNLGLVGMKKGMSRIFNSDGVSVPVTVLDVSSNRISQIKTDEKDGYNAIQIAFGMEKQNKLNKPQSGHCSKSGVEPARNFKEFRSRNKLTNDFYVGLSLNAEREKTYYATFGKNASAYLHLVLLLLLFLYYLISSRKEKGD